MQLLTCRLTTGSHRSDLSESPSLGQVNCLAAQTWNLQYGNQSEVLSQVNMLYTHWVCGESYIKMQGEKSFFSRRTNHVNCQSQGRKIHLLTFNFYLSIPFSTRILALSSHFVRPSSSVCQCNLLHFLSDKSCFHSCKLAESCGFCACMLDDQIFFPLIASLSLAAAGCLLVEQKVDCNGECLSHPETKPQAHWAPHLLKQNNKNSSKKQAIAYSAPNFVINPSFQPNKFSVKVWWTERRKKLESSPLRERWEGWAWWSWLLSSCSSRRRSRAGRLCHLSPPDQTWSTSRTKMLSYTGI